MLSALYNNTDFAAAAKPWGNALNGACVLNVAHADGVRGAMSATTAQAIGIYPPSARRHLR